MATGGGGAVRLAVNADVFEAQMQRVIRQFERYSTGIISASFSQTTFNSSGRLTDGVIRAITTSGGQMEVAIRRVGRGWQVVNQQVRQASAAQTLAAAQAEQAANRETRMAARRAAQVTAFRKEAAKLQSPTGPKSLLPAGVTPVRTRLFQGALQDLEDFVRRGKISSQRALAIIDEVNAGVNRRQKNPQHEEYRLTAMRLISASRNIRKEVDRDNQRIANRASSVNVKPALESSLGTLPTTALAGATSRMEGYYNKIARIIETTTDASGVSWTRFNQMLTQFAAGTVAPTNAAERQVVKTMRSITQEMQRETDRQAKITAKANATVDARLVKPSLDRQLGTLPVGASDSSKQRIEALYNSLAKSIESSTNTSGVNIGRFNALLVDFSRGVVSPINAAERNVVAGFGRIANTIQKETDRQAKAAQKQQAQANSTLVAPTLQSQFGQLQPGASPAAASRLEGYYNRIARAVESSTNTAGVNLPRFQKLITDFAAGVAAPVSNAERQVVKGLGNIAAEMQRDADRVARLHAQQARTLGAANAGQTIYNRLGPQISKLGEQDQERVQQQVARIQRMISRNNNPLSSAGFTAATNAGFAGTGKGSFTGVEEEARRAAARIRAVITGQLQTPFQVHIQAAQRDLSLLKNGLTILFAGNAVRQLSEGFEHLVSTAAEYQRSIALIQTITQTANVSFEQWSSSIEKVSNNLGKPIEEVAQATYDLLSNQVTSGLSDSMQVMNTAAQFARTTNSGIEDSVNLLSSAINTFKLSSGDAERVASSFFTTIDLGRVRTGEMANTIGRSAVYAQTLGVSLQELQAGIITITQTGQKADSSFTLLNNVFQKLLNPTKELQAYYDELGVGTGELFVKTYGFTGALEKLQEATGGSTAKLSDFFNEIRAFGGIDALISRSRQFKGALDELGNSAVTANIAKQKFDELPGQRFLQEMTKLRNVYLTGFQTNILKAVLAFTSFEAKIGGISIGFGGLSNALVNFGQAVVAVGSMLAVVFVGNRITVYVAAIRDAIQASIALNGATGAFGLGATAAFGAAIIAAGVLVALLIRASQEQQKYSERVAQMSEEVANKQKATASAHYSDLRAAYAKDLANERQSLLGRAAEYVKLARKRVEVETKANKEVQESAKNAYENVLSSAKASLEAIKNKQQDALKFVNEFKKTGPNRIKDSRDESLFRYRLTRNDAVNNGDVRIEKPLYQKRIRQLNDLAKNAAKQGNHEEATKYLDEKDNLINEISTKTVQVNGRTFMKYTEVETMLRQSAGYRLNIEKEISGVLEKRAKDLQQTIQDQQDAVKGLEDAYKAVYDLDTEKDGKHLFKNREEFNKQYDEKAEIARQKTEDYQKRFGKDDPTLSRDLTRRQFEIATGRTAAYRQSAGREFDARSGLARGEQTQADITKRTAEAEERYKLLTKNAEEADKRKIEQKKVFTDNFLPHANQNTITGEPVFSKVDPNSAWHQHYYNNPRTENGPEILKKAELVKDIQDAQNVGNFDLAEKKIAELMDLYRKLGLLKNKIMGADGQQTTIEANLNAARNAVRQLQQIEQERKGFQESLKANQTASDYSGTVLKELQASFGRVGDASNQTMQRISADFQAQEAMVDSLQAKLEKLYRMQQQIGPTQDEVDAADFQRKNEYKSSGGPVGYYAQGGGPRGTDTIPAWLTPGEYVVNAKQAPRYRRVLEAMNQGYYSEGGSVYMNSGGLYGGDFFATARSHNADYIKKQRERADKIAKFNAVMHELEERGVDAQSRAKMTMDFYHPHGKEQRDKMMRNHRGSFKGSGVLNPVGVDDGMDEDDYEYHAVGGWTGQGRMPGRISAMNSGFGPKSETHNDSSVNVGDINITVQGGNSGKQTAEQMGREINRAIRRKSIQLRGN
jgi:TP901 family phage tail tape measure protein